MSDGMRGRVIVWDGDAPKVWKFKARWPFVYRDIPEPKGHPKCEKIIEFGGDKPAVTYRRGN